MAKRTFSESDFADTARSKRVFTEADFGDAAPEISPTGAEMTNPKTGMRFQASGQPLVETYARGAIGQERERGFNLPNIVEELGQNSGEIYGGIIGGPAGAGAGKLLQNDLQGVGSIFGSGVPMRTAKESLGDAGKAALLQGLFTLPGKAAAPLAKTPLGRAVVEVVERAGTKASEIGAQFLRAFPAIQEKYGAALLKDPGMIFRAFPKEAIGESYEAFERYTGLKGLRQLMEERASTFSPKELEEMVLTTAKRVNAGEAVSPQELYQASQAGNHLKLAAKYNEPGAARMLESGLIKKGSESVKRALTKVLPEYENLSRSAFESKAAEQVSTVLPLNKNTSPNVLRTWSAGAVAARSISNGNPLGLLALPAISPAVYGTALAAGYGAKKAAEKALPAIRYMGPAALQQYYMRQSATP